MNNLNEMQYTQTRDEIRRNIGALYGVSAVFMNDVSTSGGLNNEGLQITVTNRAVELGQSIYNEKVIPFIFDQMGITDWEVSLFPSEEQDLVYEKDLRLKEIQIAKSMAELGIKVRMNEQGDFIYTSGEVELQNTQTDFIPFQNNEEGVTVETPVKLSKETEVKKPFADYKDFADCVLQNQDKENPESYCGSIKSRIEKKKVLSRT